MITIMTIPVSLGEALLVDKYIKSNQIARRSQRDAKGDLFYLNTKALNTKDTKYTKEI